VIFAPAYAKLNLALSVVGRRPDGRHDLCSVVVHLDWHDLVGVAPAPARAAAPAPPAVELTVSGPMASDAPPGPDNLAARAARATLEGRSGTGFWIHLVKRLPAAAGLGGGSADAATVLRLLAVAEGAAGELGPRLPVLAATLGSDVPACLAGGSLLVGGAGERLERLYHPPLHLVVAVAGRSGTAATFAALTPNEWAGPDRPEELARRLTTGEEACHDLCGSDLEAAACRAHPGLRAGVERLRAALPGNRWHLTGSGGACFALAATPEQAADLAAAAAALGFPARACRTVSAR
jgi:4-diphosphocytidyl-2-C-methyl-D-erythritol kinase